MSLKTSSLCMPSVGSTTGFAGDFSLSDASSLFLGPVTDVLECIAYLHNLLRPGRSAELLGKIRVQLCARVRVGNGIHEREIASTLAVLGETVCYLHLD